MPKPTSVPEWATNASFVSPGDPWDGDPTKVVPPAGKIAEGWEPTEEPPAEFFNWLSNLVGQWLAFLNPLLDDTDPAAVDLVYEVAPVRRRQIPIMGGAANGAGWVPNLTAWFAVGTSEDLDFTLRVPSGAELTELAVMYRITGGAPNHDAQIEGFVFDYSDWTDGGWAGSVTQQIAPAASLGTATLPVVSNDAQEIALSGLSDVSNADKVYAVRVTSDTAGGATETVWGVVARFEDPGPRNF